MLPETAKGVKRLSKESNRRPQSACSTRTVTAATFLFVVGESSPFGATSSPRRSAMTGPLRKLVGGPVLRKNTIAVNEQVSLV